MVLQPIVEPVIFALESDQHTGRPSVVIRISSDSAKRRNRDRSSLTSASAAWRIRCPVLGEPAGRFRLRDNREDFDSLARDVIEHPHFPHPKAKALQYLAPYVFKVAISERRILGVDEDHVRFRYQKPHSTRVRTMTLPIMEFMRRFLQHVLPRGFMKVRYYGFLSPSASVPLEDVKARIEMASGFTLAAPEAASDLPAALRCRHCGGALRFSRLLLPGDSAIASLAALGQPAGESSTLSAVPAGP